MEENWLNSQYVEYYNQNYATPDSELEVYISALQLSKDDSLVDFGCGCGDFLHLAMPYVKSVCGVDISSVQIESALKCRECGQNVDKANSKCSFPHGSAKMFVSPFTDFIPEKDQFTKGFSRKALHHLTDPEKARFTANIGKGFKSGALLLIEDGIFFNFEREDMEQNWQALLDDCAQYYGSSWESKKHDLMHSFRDEFPTGVKYWEKCLDKAGFDLIKKVPKSSFYGSIYARKR